MGYTKKWVPPQKSIANNLASWKGMSQDLIDNLLLSGVVSNGDTGQIDFSSVSVVPNDGVFVGYRVFKIDDGNALPIVFKLEFGSGQCGLSTNYNASYKELRIRVTVGTETDGAGNFIGDTVTFQCPQEFNHTVTSVHHTSGYNGFSFIANNQDRGFFGYFYQVDGRDGNVRAGNPEGGYNTSTLSFAIQRIPDSSGVPTSNGFMVLYPNLLNADNTSNVMLNSNLMQSRAVIFAGDGTVSQPTTQISRSTLHPYQGKVAADHPYAFDDMNNVFEMNAILITRMNSLARGQEIAIEMAPSVTQNMIAVGRETSLSFYSSRGQEHNLLMLWE